MTEGPEFEMPSHYMKEVVVSVKTKGQSQPVKTKNMTHAQDGAEVGTQDCNAHKQH
jgi:hypothetical protein